VDYSDLEQAGLGAMRLWHPGPNPSIFINYTNAPGSSVRDQFCIVTTKKNGTYIGPVNAFMTAVCMVLDAHQVSYKAEALDLEKVDKFLSRYLGGPQPAINQGWAGRDITPVVAAAVSAGLSPKTFVNPLKRIELPPATPFLSSIQTLPALNVGDTVSCRGLVDGPGDVKLSLSLSKPEVERLVAEKAVFKVSYQGNEVAEELTLAKKYQDVPFKSGVIISSSTYSIKPHEYLLEMGIRGENITERLGLQKEKSVELVLKRIR
jgi:S-adenosylmethionine hydrolase